MGRYTEAQAKSAKKYLQGFDNITIRVPKGKRDIYKELANSKGVSLNKLVTDYLESLFEDN